MRTISAPLSRQGITIHITAAGNSQGSIFEYPGQTHTTGAGGGHVGRGGEGIKVLEQGREGTFRVGDQGFLIVGKGVVGLVGRLHLVVGLRLLRHGHGLDFFQGRQGVDQGLNRFGGSLVRGFLFGRFLFGRFFFSSFLFGGFTFRAHESAGGFQDGCHIAAAFVMDMLACLSPGHAAAFLGADMAADPFPITAGFIMFMNAGGYILIAFFRMYMAAFVPLHGRRIAAFRRVRGMMRAQSVRLGGEDRNRDILQHQHTG